MIAFLLGILATIVGLTIMDGITTAFGIGLTVGGILGKWKS